MRCKNKVLCSPCNKYMRYVREGNGIESFICDECSQVVKVGSADIREKFFTSTNTAKRKVIMNKQGYSISELKTIIDSMSRFFKVTMRKIQNDIDNVSNYMESIVSEFSSDDSKPDKQENNFSKNEETILINLSAINKRIEEIEKAIDPIKLNISTYQDAETRRDKVLSRLSALEKDVQYLMTKNEMKGAK